MKTWRRAIEDALISGSAASIASSIAVASCGKAEYDDPISPTNATSHWVWGERATRQGKPSIRYTLVGYLIHHLASVFWAVFFERWFGDRRKKSELLQGAATVSALACLVDYRLTPKRLTPGFERHLSRRSLLLVYTAFALGLAVAGYLEKSGPHR